LLISLLLAAVVGLPVTGVEPAPEASTTSWATATPDLSAAESAAAEPAGTEHTVVPSQVAPAAAQVLPSTRPVTARMPAAQDTHAARTPRAPPLPLG
jgi:hypothetical protein